MPASRVVSIGINQCHKGQGENWMSIRGLQRWQRHTLATAILLMSSAVVFATAAQAATLPEGRAYELVSPVQKFGAVPDFPGGAGVGGPYLGAMTGASSHGDHLLWISAGAFANAGSAIPMSFESSRTLDGWSTVQASPDPVSAHPNVLLSVAVIRDATADLSRRIITSQEEFDPLIQGGFGGALKYNIFTQDANGNLAWVSRPNSGPSTALTNAQYEGRDAQANHIVFGTREDLVTSGVGEFGRGLYDRSGGQTVVVNVDDGGTPVNACGATLGVIPNVGFPDGRITAGAVSSDGERIVFTAPDPTGSGDPSCSEPATVYVRSDGSTVVASASQRTSADPMGQAAATFQGAIDGGGNDKVLFTSDEALTNDAADGTTGDPLLYEYDVPSGNLTLLTPNSAVAPRVDGVVGEAQDGSRVYLIARGSLTSDAPSDEQDKLYVYTRQPTGHFTYIGPVDPGDLTPLLSGEAARSVRVTPNGDEMLFVTSGNLRSFTTGGHGQAYLYDASDDALSCVSCPGGTGTPDGTAGLSSDSAANIRPAIPRNLTDDGQIAYFETTTALVPQDDNTALDVYEWHEGHVSLISGGHGQDPSFFVDSANDGNDVFFWTTDHLVGQDTNADADIYDARVGGGFPAPPAPPAPCIDDACQGQSATVPVLPAVASDTDFGNGATTSNAKRRLSVASVSAGARRAFVRTGKLTLRLRVSGAGTAVALARSRLRGEAKVVAHARRSISRAGSLRLELVLSRASRRWLARNKELRLSIAVTFPGAMSKRATMLLVAPTRAKW